MKTTYSAILFAGLLLAGMTAWAGPVNINKANAGTLSKELVGVGPVKARAIVSYRNAHGPFKSAAALTRVTGIGSATVNKNKANIHLNGGKGAPHKKK